MAELAIGQPAPQFELPRDGGQTIRLADLRGKIVVLFFYPKDGTSGCTTEAIDFSRNMADFEKSGAVVIGISPDSVRKHEGFIAKHALSTPLVSDTEQIALESYGVWSQKQMYGRSYMGVVRSTFLIDREGLIAGIWRNVRVDGHVGEVLAAVQSL